MSPQKPYTDAEERIFEAALHVFARKGKDGARMQEIADAAQINKAMLHYYFRSKDRLYEQVLDFVMRRFMHTFDAALDQADPFPLLLRSFIDGYVDHIRENLDVMRLMVNEQLSGGAVLRRRMQALLAEGHAAPQRFAQHVAAAAAAGQIRPVDPRQTLITVVSGCLFFFVAHPMVASFIPEAEAHPDAFIAQRKAHLFDLLYHGLQPRPTL